MFSSCVWLVVVQSFSVSLYNSSLKSKLICLSSSWSKSVSLHPNLVLLFANCVVKRLRDSRFCNLELSENHQLFYFYHFEVKKHGLKQDGVYFVAVFNTVIMTTYLCRRLPTTKQLK